MQRVTIRMPVGLLDEVEEQVEDGYFSSRSEAIRHHIRQGIQGGERRERERARV